jgi:hypothetical protein
MSAIIETSKPFASMVLAISMVFDVSPLLKAVFSEESMRLS